MKFHFHNILKFLGKKSLLGYIILYFYIIFRKSKNLKIQLTIVTYSKHAKNVFKNMHKFRNNECLLLNK